MIEYELSWHKIGAKNWHHGKKKWYKNLKEVKVKEKQLLNKHGCNIEFLRGRRVKP